MVVALCGSRASDAALLPLFTALDDVLADEAEKLRARRERIREGFDLALAERAHVVRVRSLVLLAPRF